ncbi:HxlR family transcriptional regulator [Prauserella shujinwangii]|uniref:HxlR family transcriptional regulator n=1 Tax=Prauserella shujinwangii TaxID=1453103 RepID=A0A2T0M156_9PSEU|nr:helix-turn-helix domain-containing protein [Prauserella shujinwangii]PRX50332.1 HxlR family transcriptional regulator [Prauserella shujinwangii]
MRTYDDPCGLARALDLVGERWALLVVRELLLGPKRFADLRRGLPGLSQNVLSQRLRELGDAGVVRRAGLGPPSGAQVYELTERGRGLQPVLVELARWGSRTELRSSAELSTDALLLALRTTFDPAAAAGRRAVVELRLDGDAYRAEVADGDFAVRREAAGDPAAVVDTDAPTLRSLVFGRRRPADAERDGTVRVRGDRDTAIWFLTLFPRPRE